MGPDSRSEVVLEVAESVRNLQQGPDADVDTVLGELTEGFVKWLPGARYASITIASRDGTVRTAAATVGYPAALDEIRQRHHKGPGLSTAWEQHVVRIDDVALGQRWPDYCRDVAQETSVRSIVSFELFADNRTVGALNFYAEQPHAFDDEAVELGLIFATHTAVVWNTVRRDEQFRSALASRDIIGQAKGMLMERFNIDAVQAFEILKRLSQDSNTPVAAIARRLVECRHAAAGPMSGADKARRPATIACEPGKAGG